MRLGTYYCSDREARMLYPNLAGPGLRVVIAYELSPSDSDGQKRLLWDGRTVIAAHKRSGRMVARIIAEGGARLRESVNGPHLAIRDWRIVGTLHTVSVERVVIEGCRQLLRQEISYLSGRYADRS